MISKKIQIATALGLINLKTFEIPGKSTFSVRKHIPFDVSAFIFHWMRLLQPSVLHSLSTKNISPVHKVIPDRLRIFIKRFLMLDFSCSGFLLEIVGWSEERSAQQFNFNTPVYNLRICNHSAIFQKGHQFFILYCM